MTTERLAARALTPESALPRSAARIDELEYFVGQWDAPGQFHATPFGGEKPIEMRVTGSHDIGSSWITMRTAEQPMAQNSDPLRAWYVWGYDAVADEFVADWFDSNGGRGRQRSVGWRKDTLVFQGTMTMSGATVPLRDTFARSGPDAYHHLGELDLGQGWIPVDEEWATRISVVGA